MSMKKESPLDAHLHIAALQGDVDTLRRVLDSGRVHVDCKDRDGTTPLILAAANGHLDCVEELLEQGADPRARRTTGTTALFFAAQGGFLDIAQALLDNGAQVDSASMDGGTPLFVACQCGHMDVAKELISRGANVNAHMKDRATPLFMAAQNGHGRVVLHLLEHGALVDTRRTDGATPLWIAAQMGHERIVRVLLRNGAAVDTTRHDGATPLFKAAHKGHSTVVDELLQYRPSLKLLPFRRIFGYRIFGSARIFDIRLFEYFENLAITTLHAAALFGHLTVVRKLLAAGSDPALRNQEGMTAAQLAAEHKHRAVVDVLAQSVRS